MYIQNSLCVQPFALALVFFLFMVFLLLGFLSLYLLVNLLFEAVPSPSMLVVRVISGLFSAFAVISCPYWVLATSWPRCLLLGSADRTEAGRPVGQIIRDPC